MRRIQTGQIVSLKSNLDAMRAPFGSWDDKPPSLGLNIYETKRHSTSPHCNDLSGDTRANCANFQRFLEYHNLQTIENVLFSERISYVQARPKISESCPGERPNGQYQPPSCLTEGESLVCILRNLLSWDE